MRKRYNEDNKWSTGQLPICHRSPEHTFQRFLLLDAYQEQDMAPGGYSTNTEIRRLEDPHVAINCGTRRRAPWRNCRACGAPIPSVRRESTRGEGARGPAGRQDQDHHRRFYSQGPSRWQAHHCRARRPPRTAPSSGSISPSRIAEKREKKKKTGGRKARENYPAPRTWQTEEGTITTDRPPIGRPVPAEFSASTRAAAGGCDGRRDDAGCQISIEKEMQ